MSLKNSKSPASSPQMGVTPAGEETPRKTSRYGEGESGMCVRCKEWTEVGASCCGAGVWFEGSFVADFEEDDDGADLPGGESDGGPTSGGDAA